MKRGIVIAAGAVVVLAIALAAIFVSHRGRATTDRGFPAGAQAAVRLLLSARGRHALTPALNESLRAGRLFPAGTTFTVRPASWRQVGAYANVSGMLRLPGKPPVPAEIGLVYQVRHWLVTFEATQ